MITSPVIPSLPILTFLGAWSYSLLSTLQELVLLRRGGSPILSFLPSIYYESHHLQAITFPLGPPYFLEFSLDLTHLESNRLSSTESSQCSLAYPSFHRWKQGVLYYYSRHTHPWGSLWVCSYLLHNSGLQGTQLPWSIHRRRKREIKHCCWDRVSI